MAKEIYIDENGNEQMVSGTINNASLLPISASDSTNTKDYIDTGLSGKQSTINNSYSIDGLSTPSGITRQNGGYTKIGNLVIVNVRLNCTNSVQTETDILLGLPTPVGNANIVAVTFNKDTYGVITTSGSIRVVGNALTSGVVLASACYLTSTI